MFRFFLISILVGLCSTIYAEQLPADSVEVKVMYKRLWFQERLFMIYLNGYRLINLRQPLIGIGTPRMHRGAFRHSVDMAKTKRFAHYNFNKRSEQYHFRGENIIMGENGAWSCFTSWRKSKGHRENMLDWSFFFTGVGFVRAKIIKTEVIDEKKKLQKLKVLCMVRMFLSSIVSGQPSNPTVKPTQSAHLPKATHPNAQPKAFAKSAAPTHQYWTDLYV